MAEAQAAMVSVRRDNTDPRISRGFPAGLQALLTPDALKLKAGRIKAAANLLVFCVTGRRCVCVGVCVCGSHMKRLLGDGMLDDQLNSVKFLPKDSNAETFEFSVVHAAQRHLRDTFDGTDLSNMQFWNLIIEAVVGRRRLEQAGQASEWALSRPKVSASGTVNPPAEAPPATSDISGSWAAALASPSRIQLASAGSSGPCASSVPRMRSRKPSCSSHSSSVSSS